MPAPTLEFLYDSFGPMVLRRARAMLSDEQAAWDATQEVFLKVLSALPQFRQESSPVTWLYRATTNHCLNLLRERARRGEGELTDELGESHHPRHEERLTLLKVLNRVQPELREIAVYYYLDQMSQDEIASLTGLSRRTVGNRLVAFHEAAKLAAGSAAKAEVS
jgi:RNA polymerase sigma-70 factor, ECF subfamily